MTTDQVWTLIFAEAYGIGVQQFVVSGDPQMEARRLAAELDWLKGHSLIAAVKGTPLIRTRDDAQDSLTLL